MTRIVFLDTETTSLNDLSGEVWQIGLIDRTPEGDVEWLWQVAPVQMYGADPNSVRFNKFYERFDTRATLQGAMIFKAPGMEKPNGEETTRADVAATVAELVAGAHVVGAVPDFDFRFLRGFLASNEQIWAAHYHLIDVETLALGWLHAMPSVDRLNAGLGDDLFSLPWDSKKLSRAVGVDPDQFAAHTALGDAKWARAIYDAVTGGPR